MLQQAIFHRVLRGISQSNVKHHFVFAKFLEVLSPRANVQGKISQKDTEAISFETRLSNQISIYKWRRPRVPPHIQTEANLNASTCFPVLVVSARLFFSVSGDNIACFSKDSRKHKRWMHVHRNLFCL